MSGKSLTLTLQDSRYTLPELYLLLILVLSALASPFCAIYGLHYDLYYSISLFLYLSHFRGGILWTSVLSVYIDIAHALPLGSSCGFLFVLWCGQYMAHRFVHKKAFLPQWMIFISLYTVGSLLQWWRNRHLLGIHSPSLVEGMSFFLTISAYPLLYKILASLYHRLPPLTK